MHFSKRFLIAAIVLVAIISGLVIFVLLGSNSDSEVAGGLYGRLNLGRSSNKGAALLAPGMDWLGKKVPPLPDPEGEVVNVSNYTELFGAVSGAKPGQTIVLAEGTYEVTVELGLVADGVTLRGASNDRSKVVLKGNGLKGNSFVEASSAIFVSNAKNVTIANLTIHGFSLHGITVQGQTEPHGLRIYNVGFYDIGQRSIKVNAINTNPPVENGIVEYCYFEQIEEIDKGRNDGFNGDYVAGIDAHNTKGWIIRDNVFKSIRGANGGGRAAIFIWNCSQDAIVERNLIVDCDRGIAFGNPHIHDGIPYHNKGGIIRNNMVHTRRNKIGIEIVAAKDLKVYNNTVVNENQDYDLAIKYAHNITSVELINNLVSGKISQCPYQTGAEAVLKNNLDGVPADWFVDPFKGNMTFTSKVQDVIGKGVMLDEVADDFFGTRRKVSSDIGAFQTK